VSFVIYPFIAEAVVVVGLVTWVMVSPFFFLCAVFPWDLGIHGLCVAVVYLGGWVLFSVDTLSPH